MFRSTISASLLALAVSTTSAVAVGSGSGSGSSSNSNAEAEYQIAKSAIYAGRYESAIRRLNAIVRADDENADAYNLLGFASRKLGRLDDAERYYQIALRLEPNHRGALEYQGELYLMQGNPNAARANLAELRRLCGTGCPEYLDLKADIAAYGGS